jgi:hypothetical protein
MNHCIGKSVVLPVVPMGSFADASTTGLKWCLVKSHLPGKILEAPIKEPTHLKLAVFPLWITINDTLNYRIQVRLAKTLLKLYCV